MSSTCQKKRKLNEAGVQAPPSKTKMNKVRITVAGWTQCSYFQKAWTATAAMGILHPKKVEVVKVELPSRDAYKVWLAEEKPKLKLNGGGSHTSSPFVWLDESQFLGGADATLDYIKERFMGSTAKESSTPANKSDDVILGAFDYDLVCIGGGSGGLALTKEAASLGAKVACLDFVKPSVHGTTWGLGGTCVNVGCIPKKLCHRAAILGEEGSTEAKDFGWEGTEMKHNWAALQENVHNYIRSLNFKYKVALRDKKVKYINALGKIKDAHTLTLTDKKGKVTEITAGRIVVAVGGRPTPLDCPGGEHAIDSDDVFQMDWTSREGTQEPGKTLVVGASYVALECAGFLTGLGYDTTVMVRSILLRGFDREYSDLIGDYMGQHTKFIRGSVPTKIEQLADKRFQVFWNVEGKEESDIYDTVIAAIGRRADTSKLGLETIGVETSKNGKIICADHNDQTNVPNVYAVGDVVQDMLELTPVAIQAGILLARRLYSSKQQTMDYDLIPTTVFTPIEYGACGLSEEQATEKYGADDLEIYHKELSPLEWELSSASKPAGIARCKLICLKSENLLVVGLHILAPNSGEITQGFATAMRKGATYRDFQDTVGIHPTVAEDFTTLTVTKSSGESAAGSGC